MDLFTSGLAAKVADGTLAYYGKGIAPSTVSAYRRLLDHARAVFRRRVIDQTRATHTLLQLFEARQRRPSGRSWSFIGRGPMCVDGVHHPEVPQCGQVQRV